MRSLSFYALGEPAGQPRLRACIRGRTPAKPGKPSKPRAGVYDPGTADSWRTVVSSAAKAAWDGRIFSGPIRLSLTIYMPRPKHHFRADGVLKPTAPRWHTSKPDRDNIEKAVKDAITHAGIWKDDSLVCDGPTSKLYALPGQSGALIRIEEITE